MLRSSRLYCTWLTARGRPRRCRAACARRICAGLKLLTPTERILPASTRSAMASISASREESPNGWCTMYRPMLYPCRWRMRASIVRRMLPARAHERPPLGGHDHVFVALAGGLQRGGERGLRDAVAVQLGRVEPVDAAIQPRAHGGVLLILRDEGESHTHQAAAPGKLHHAEADGSHLDAGLAQRSHFCGGFHRRPRSRACTVAAPSACSPACLRWPSGSPSRCVAAQPAASTA